MIDVIGELRKIGRNYPAKAEPIPVCFSQTDIVGYVENRRGLYLNPASERLVRAMLRDQRRAELTARDVSNGLLGANDLLPIIAGITDKRDAVRSIQSMRMAIQSWNDVINARASGKYWDFLGTKASQTTVASNWSSFLRTGGNPGAASYSNIPGPAAFDSTTTGAWPLPMSLGASDNLYLSSLGTNHATGTNIVLAVDVLTANGNILTSIVTSQNVNSTAIPRWTGGSGVMMTLEVTTAPSTSTGVPNVTINYTNQGGTGSQSTGAITWGVTSPAVGRLLPLQDGPMIRLASGDYGVQSVQQCTFSVSAAGAGGNMALLQYKPLVLIPTLSTTSWIERSTPAQIGGIKPLTSNAQGSKAFIGFFVLTSTTSTGVMTYLIETVYG